MDLTEIGHLCYWIVQEWLRLLLKHWNNIHFLLFLLFHLGLLAVEEVVKLVSELWNSIYQLDFQLCIVFHSDQFLVAFVRNERRVALAGDTTHEDIIGFPTWKGTALHRGVGNCRSFYVLKVKLWFKMIQILSNFNLANYDSNQNLVKRGVVRNSVFPYSRGEPTLQRLSFGMGECPLQHCSLLTVTSMYGKYTWKWNFVDIHISAFVEARKIKLMWITRHLISDIEDLKTHKMSILDSFTGAKNTQSNTFPSSVYLPPIEVASRS